MLSFTHPRERGINRRSFLQVGTLGLGGLTFPGLLQLQAQTKSVMHNRSVIFLFQHGGPSQYETFDPKMTAPAEIRSMTGEIKTSIPGITFGSTMQKLAKIAHKFTTVRSYVPGDANHDAKPIVHKETLGANLGSYYSRVVGLNHPTTGVPTNVLLYPESVKPNATAPVANLGNFPASGPLGSAYAPFIPGGSGELQKNMRLQLSPQQFEDRRSLLTSFDRIHKTLDHEGTLETYDRYTGQAFDVILRGVADAFDLSKEDPRLIARYDTAPLVNVDAIDKKWNNKKYYTDHAQCLGKMLLLARRMCEAGCGFVTVNTNFVWDMHSDQNNAPPSDAMPYVGGPFDHAVSALIEDIEARGLSDRILLVCCGEMGRTPRINKKGGRDHWGNIGPLMLYGGGLPMGEIIGKSNQDGGSPASPPVTIRSLISTIMHTLLDIGQVRLISGISGDVSKVITDGQPIPELIR
ncbi:MAG: DUF1501 domain-containing protein [Zavarzinella sp.]